MPIIFENGKCLNKEFVIITEYGQYYHDNPECPDLGSPDNNLDVTILDALNTGFNECAKCYG